MSGLAIVGSQWGDEGKGKIIDYLADRADMVVRAQGGSNAGHTVVVGSQKFALHLIPSGVLNPKAENVIGNGVVFDPEEFFKELEGLEQQGLSFRDRIYISDRAHIVFPYHKIMDGIYEGHRSGSHIGTTGKGIGPCYMDKVERSGIRICDTLNQENFIRKLSEQIDRKNEIIVKVYGEEPLDKEETISRYTQYAKQLQPFIRDTGVLVYEAMKEDRKVLFEGAQGSLLDIDLGTYPFVTSSHPISGGFTTGAGIGSGSINQVLGIAKAYTTRVGEGPFVTEEDNETGNRIRQLGHEFGVTTGRPRRCGWFDGVILRYSARINGMTGIALMLLDVLSDFDTVKLCDYYEHQGQKVEHFPARLDLLDQCTPVYRELPGWKCDISGCRTYGELPLEARNYVAEIETITGVPVKIISVGPDRKQTIIRDEAIF